MDIRTRLKTYLSDKESTPSSFAIKCGVDPSNFRKMLKGELAITNKTINKISANSDINKDWLLTGEGPMLNTAPLRNEVEDLTPEENKWISKGLNSGEFRMVPLINIDSVGGMHSGNAIDLSEQYIIKMMPFADALPGDVAILQSGNSMYPTIPPGSALLIREVTNWREYFGYGGIFVLLLSDGRRITKEVRRYEEDPRNYIWCVSYNPDVADEELPKSLISGVWKVIKYIADFGW